MSNTRTSSTVLIDTGAGDDTFPTTFNMGALNAGNCDVDLLGRNYGAGSISKASAVELIFTGDAAGSGTVIIAASSDGGPVLHICSLALTVGSVASDSAKVVDTIVATDTHATSVGVSDSGNSRFCKVTLDMTGLRYLKIYNTSLTTTAELKTYMRYYA